MTRPLSLHQITAMEASPAELVAIAAEVGCNKVCIFTHLPGAALPDESKSAPFPLLTMANKGAFGDALRRHGVGVANIEYFPIRGDVAAEDYRAGFALGAEFGAELAVSHIHDDDAERAVATLGQVADLAAEYRLAIGVEFMGLTPACNSVQRAAWFIERVARPNVRIAVDALHLARTGGTPADIRGLPGNYFAYAQICDGHGLHRSADYLPEALDREMPGDGDFPLQELIEALPASLPLDVEVPSVRLANAGVAAVERAREAVARTRVIIERARVTR